MLREHLPVNALFRDNLMAVAALIVIAGLFLATPGSLLDKADRAAYAVCHRIGDRSFYVAGRQLPLCARCSGTYLGALAGFSVLAARGRKRSARLPGKRYLAVLGVFLALWAVDGFNSYLTLFPGLPYLYEPHNLVRLATGTLEGLAIAAVMLPVANMTFWRLPGTSASIASGSDLLWLLAGGALVVVVVASTWEPLLYALALASAAMVLILVGAINTFVVLVVLRREGRAEHWRDLAGPIAAGIALAATELAVIGIGRDALTAALRLPF